MPGGRASCAARPTARRQDVRAAPGARPDACRSAAWRADAARPRRGRTLSLDRGPGGLRAHYTNARGDEREWTILGASRGEAGILGEGIRQALLRDPTYGPRAGAPPTAPGELRPMASGALVTAVADEHEAAERAAEVLATALDAARTVHGAAPREPVRRLHGPRLRAARRAPARTGRDVHFWFSDERCVPPDDEESIYRLVQETLVAPGAEIHRAPGELGPEEAARRYAEDARRRRARRGAAGHGPRRPHRVAVPRPPGAARRGPDGAGARLAQAAARAHHAHAALPQQLRGASCSSRRAPRRPTALARVIAGPDEQIPASLLDRDRLEIVADEAALGARRPGPDAPMAAPHEVWLLRHAETEWSRDPQAHRPHRHPADRRRAARTPGALRERAGRPPASRSCSRARSAARARPRELAGLGDRAAAARRRCSSGTTATTRAARRRRSARRGPDWYLWRDGCPGGESPADVQRARRPPCVAEALAADGDVALVAHGHVLRAVGARWIEQPVAHRRPPGARHGRVQRARLRARGPRRAPLERPPG